ncbi:MAG: gfo/Idh/MocA family oxidoreductase, partial [Verrucomicrobiales bacterium]
PPVLQIIDALTAEGGIGKLLEIRGRGKGDRRGGGEDLWVLGTHVMNLMAYFGGTPKSCSAVMLQDGRRVTKAD